MKEHKILTGSKILIFGITCVLGSPSYSTVFRGKLEMNVLKREGSRQSSLSEWQTLVAAKE